MSRKFLLVPADSGKPCTWVTRPDHDTLDWMQAQVGGYIEHVTLEHDGGDPDENDSIGASVWCNEDGIAMSLPYNSRGSDLFLWYFGVTACALLGDVLIEIRGKPSKKLSKWLDDVVSMVPA